MSVSFPSIADRLIGWSLLDFLHPLRLRKLYQQYEPFESIDGVTVSEIAALLNLKESQASLVRNPLQLPSIRHAVRRLREFALTPAQAGYPRLLLEIGDAPAALHLRGRRDLLQRSAVAIVGSRHASRYGIAAAEHLAHELGSRGITIVSGLARGIDGAAHAAALSTPGSTIAVLGTGLDIDYPRPHIRLKREIAENGLLVTSFPPNTPARPPHFPIRNRIIAGLCLGTVVVEATGHSGSLITARLAAEQGREVFAVPGPIFHAGSEGPNRLIQYGAKLVHDVEDILEELRLPDVCSRDPQKPTREQREPESEELRSLLSAFAPAEALHVDELAARLELPVAALAEGLFTLELEGFIESLPGARYARIRTPG